MPSVGVDAAARVGEMDKNGAKIAATNNNSAFLLTLMLPLFYPINKKPERLSPGLVETK